MSYLAEYVQSYRNEDYESTEMSQVKILYLIGDLYKRLGDEKQAILYLSRVIQHKEETLEKRMVDLARESWQEIREKQKSNLKTS